MQRHTGLVDPKGKLISSADFKKDPAPRQGEAFGPWAGRDVEFMQMPGGGLVQFDLSKLTLGDYRNMTDHYQVNSSLAVLSFMQHQSDWTIECEDKKIADACTDMLTNIWTPLNRSLATANWAGYSPNILDWENDIDKRVMTINKVKDLIPEECEVHWDTVEGWAPPGRVKPKYKIYDGINYFPQKGWPVPVENSFWYPLLMQNGDYYGRKLLRPAFQSWFFSILIHLFANRYFERFGEPTPIGRAPFEEEMTLDGKNVNSRTYMLDMIQQLRNRSVVVLPNDRSQVGNNGQTEFDYELEYLESQMRGADFERYLTRLDEEISLGLFTPILLLRTADVGSYNLGVGHMQVYLWMLNAMNDDRAVYIDKYLLSRMVDYNFGVNAPRAKIVFRKLGDLNAEMISSLLQALVSKDKVKLDYRELGEMAGMTIEEIKETVAPAVDPNADPAATDPAAQDDPATAKGKPVAVAAARSMTEPRTTAKEIVTRVGGQVEAAFRDGRFGPDLRISMGYKRQMAHSLGAGGFSDPLTKADDLYRRMDNWIADITSSLDPADFSSGAESFMDLFEKVLSTQLEELAHA